MAEVTMPRLSDTMQEGTIASWLKKPGDQVNKGDVLAQIETDKAVMDLTAFESGTLQEILAPEGSTVPIGQPVARIGAGGAAQAAGQAKAPQQPQAQPAQPPAETRPPEQPRAQQPAQPPPTETAQPPATAATGAQAPETPAARENVAEAPEPTRSPQQQPTVPTPRAPSGDGAETGKVRASPMARHIAAEHGLDLSRIEGSGPQGRIIRADVEAALAGQQPPRAPAAVEAPAAPPPPAVDEAERVPLSQMRRTIARRMAESTRTVPHFFLTVTVDATELVKLRKQILEQLGEGDVKVTFNDLVIRGAALALRKMPDVNVSFAEDSLIRHKHIHIGIAVATERGLIVPVLRDADQKSIGQIAREARDLGERAHAGKLQPPDYTGGTFTISNLGMFGIEQFDAVINPPEAAILAVGAITREPVAHEGEIVLRDRMKLTMSIDHRALDGATGARYLQALKGLLEKPMLLLV